MNSSNVFPPRVAARLATSPARFRRVFVSRYLFRRSFSGTFGKLRAKSATAPATQAKRASLEKRICTGADPSGHTSSHWRIKREKLSSRTDGFISNINSRSFCKTEQLRSASSKLEGPRCQKSRNFKKLGLARFSHSAKSRKTRQRA